MQERPLPDEVLDVRDEAKARRWLEDALRLRRALKAKEPLTDTAWAKFYDGGRFLDRDVDGDRDEQDDWVDYCCKELEWARQHVTEEGYGGRTTRLRNSDRRAEEREGYIPFPDGFLTAYERDRAVALSQETADRVARLEWVQNFRRIVLAGQTLTQANARRFLTSPAVRFLPFKRFVELEIPVLGHSAAVVENQNGALRIEVTPPGGTVEVAPPPGGWDAQPSLVYDAEVGMEIHSMRIQVSMPGWEERQTRGAVGPERCFGHDPALWAIWEGRDPFPHILPSSLAGDLNNLASRWLAFVWDPGTAARFVLTGAFPRMRAITTAEILPWPEGIGMGSRRQFEITAEEWVGPITIAKVWQSMQLGAQVKRPRKGGRQPLAARGEALVAFIRSRPPAETKADWRRLREEWNALPTTLPEWQFREGGGFHRAYDRAKAGKTGNREENEG
jgi:hypothetical protein